MKGQTVFTVIQMPNARIGALRLDRTFRSRSDANRRCAELNQSRCPGEQEWRVDQRVG